MGNWSPRRKAYAALFLVVAVVALNDLVWYRVGEAATFCVWSEDARDDDGTPLPEHPPDARLGTGFPRPLGIGAMSDFGCQSCEYRLEFRSRWVLPDWERVTRWSACEVPV